jgi:hypothetical protein
MKFLELEFEKISKVIEEVFYYGDLIEDFTYEAIAKKIADKDKIS